MSKTTESGKFLRDETIKIASDPKYDDYQRGLASIFTRFLIKNLVEVVLTLNQVINLQINFRDKLLENLRERKFIHLLETMFGLLI